MLIKQWFQSKCTWLVATYYNKTNNVCSIGSNSSFYTLIHTAFNILHVWLNKRVWETPWLGGGLQLLRLRFLLRFSSSDQMHVNDRTSGWANNVLSNVLSICTLIWTFITHPHVKIALEIASKIVSVNGPV
jgi:hypothetical protein